MSLSSFASLSSDVLGHVSRRWLHDGFKYRKSALMKLGTAGRRKSLTEPGEDIRAHLLLTDSQAETEIKSLTWETVMQQAGNEEDKESVSLCLPLSLLYLYEFVCWKKKGSLKTRHAIRLDLTSTFREDRFRLKSVVTSQLTNTIKILIPHFWTSLGTLRRREREQLRTLLQISPHEKCSHFSLTAVLMFLIYWRPLLLLMSCGWSDMSSKRLH